MVGVPRSKGCSLCVRRRVKCDQVHPACGNCTRYGAECPGFNRILKFVTGKHVVRSTKTRGRSGHQPASSASPTSSHSSLAKTAGVAQIRLYGDTNALTSASMPTSLRQECAPFILGLMGQLFTIHPRDEVLYTAPWFTSMLDYLDNDPVLDSAMSALMLQMVGKAKRDAGAQEIGWGRDLYGRALVNLQRALNHPTAWKAVETFAATIICCLYELFAGTTTPLSWMMHASGITKLVLARGPGSFNNPFEKALLRSARPILITKSVFTGEDCFLNRPKWRKVSSNLTIDEAPSGRLGPSASIRLSTPRWNKHHDVYFVILARIPGVVAAGYNMREWRNHGIKPSPVQAAQVEQQTSELRREYLAWYRGALKDAALSLPVEVPPQDPTSPFATVFRWANPWIGALCTHYWATMLVLQECLDQCQDDVGDRIYTNDNQELSNCILRSLEHVGQGLMGPYRVGYSIRIAYDFVVDPRQREWLLSVIRKYSTQFASVSSETYPENPAHLGSGEQAEEAGPNSPKAKTLSWLN